MTDEKILLNNLEILAKTDPKLALRLDLLGEPEEMAPASLPFFPRSAEVWFSTLSLEGIEVLYVYGIADGTLFSAAKKWLAIHPEHHLVFLEDEIDILHAFLTTHQATEILQHPQVQIAYCPPSLQKEIVERFTWYFLECSLAVAAIPLYAEKKREEWKRLDHALQYEAALKHALVDEYLHYGFAFYRNYYPNLFLLEDAYHGNALFGEAKGIPAIICGAGPSLNKNASLLNECQDKALIFAGGSALNALHAMGIRPHFGAGIDPNREQKNRIEGTREWKVPFFYRNRIFHDALALVQGPRLFVTGSGGYDIAEWVEERLGIEGEMLEEGHNVIHFCTELARAMGCNPILFVGVDLALTGGSAYAEGIEGTSGVRNSPDEIPVLQEDIYGQPIKTLWKWVAEREWLSDFAKTHTELELINCTEGGLGFPPIPNRPLKEVIENWQANPGIQTLLKEKLPHSRLPVQRKEIVDLLNTLRDSLLRCQQLCGGILQEVSKIEKKLQKNSLTSTDWQTGASALYETELGEEPAYGAILDIFASVLGRLLQREVHKIEVLSSTMTQQEREVELLKVRAKRLQFLEEAARLHAELIGQVVKG